MQQITMDNIDELRQKAIDNIIRMSNNLLNKKYCLYNEPRNAIIGNDIKREYVKWRNSKLYILCNKQLINDKIKQFIIYWSKLYND